MFTLFLAEILLILKRFSGIPSCYLSTERTFYFFNLTHLFSSCLIDLVNTTRTVLNNCGKSDHSCPVFSHEDIFCCIEVYYFLF